MGRSLGEEAAKVGADLVLASRTEKRLDKMAEVVRSHGRGLVVPTDIDDPAPAEPWSPRRGAYGKVDCLINNAFAIPPMDPLTKLDHDAIARLRRQRRRAAAALDAVRPPAEEAQGGRSSCQLRGGAVPAPDGGRTS